MLRAAAGTEPDSAGRADGTQRGRTRAGVMFACFAAVIVVTGALLSGGVAVVDRPEGFATVAALKCDAAQIDEPVERFLRAMVR